MLIEIFWVLFMVGLVATTVVVSLQERKARQAKLAPARAAAVDQSQAVGSAEPEDPLAVSLDENVEFNPDDFK
ncbi:MAG: hypothetical protein KF752_00840 [Pirellulaceae bacterium]|nr:hypothetical protein [Pirellulaceae bacterium]